MLRCRVQQPRDAERQRKFDMQAHMPIVAYPVAALMTSSAALAAEQISGAALRLAVQVGPAAIGVASIVLGAARLDEFDIIVRDVVLPLL